MIQKYPLNLWKKKKNGFQESCQNPINVLVEKTEEQPTYLFLVNILPWQDVYCTEKPVLKPHWKPSQSIRKWAEWIQNAEKIHIQIKNGDESTQNFKQACCSTMIFRHEKWQDRASCDKNSDKSLHRPQVELEGSWACPLRRVPLHRSRKHNTLPWETGSFH